LSSVDAVNRLINKAKLMRKRGDAGNTCPFFSVQPGEYAQCLSKAGEHLKQAKNAQKMDEILTASCVSLFFLPLMGIRTNM
jgi:hypothetical protein